VEELAAVQIERNIFEKKRRIFLGIPFIGLGQKITSPLYITEKNFPVNIVARLSFVTCLLTICSRTFFVTFPSFSYLRSYDRDFRQMTSLLSAGMERDEGQDRKCIELECTRLESVIRTGTQFSHALAASCYF
jgi:hypothetical protein